jgi:hypothetical protein
MICHKENFNLDNRRTLKSTYIFCFRDSWLVINRFIEGLHN